MATVQWVTVRRLWCERAEAEAALMEERLYPADRLPDVPSYRVTARKCSHGIQCNLAGCSCKWAFTNPFYDPFEN